MIKYYDLSDGSDEAQTFWAILSELYTFADTDGIRAALDKFTALHPFYADSLEATVEEGAEFEFLIVGADDEDDLPESTAAVERRSQMVREALARAHGEYTHEKSGRLVWDGRDWIDNCGNGFSSLYLAIGFWDV